MSNANNDYTPGRGKVYVSEMAESDRSLPRYITVTPDEGAVITIAVPWAQIDAAVQAAGYEIVPRVPKGQIPPPLPDRAEKEPTDAYAASDHAEMPSWTSLEERAGGADR